MEENTNLTPLGDSPSEGEKKNEKPEVEVLPPINNQDPTYAAYLLIRLRRVPQTPVPVVIGAGIYSSPPGSITCCGSEFYAELLRETGKDYHEASNRLRAVMKHPSFAWLEFFLEDQSGMFGKCPRHFNHYNCEGL